MKIDVEPRGAFATYSRLRRRLEMEKGSIKGKHYVMLSTEKIHC